MNQKEVLEFDGFRVERESFLGGDCYGVEIGRAHV